MSVVMQSVKKVAGNLLYFGTTSGLDGQVSVLFDETVPVRSGGFAGWQEVARPKRAAVLEWAGVDVPKCTFGVLVEGWPDVSVESMCNTLEAMASPPDDLVAPPVLRLTGPMPLNGSDVVITDLAMGDNARKEFTNVRVRQRYTITVALWNTSSLVAGAVNTRPTKKPYTVRKGDTWQSVAKRELHDASRWREIVRLNPRLYGHATNGATRLRVGTKIWVPWS